MVRPSRAMCRSPGDSQVPANHDPIMTLVAPRPARGDVPGMPDATVGPDVRTELPGGRCAPRTAENCGRPTPVIIRVVRIAPGPTPTLTMSAPASTKVADAPAATTLPATSGTSMPSARTARSASSIFSWCPCAVSRRRRRHRPRRAWWRGRPRLRPHRTLRRSVAARRRRRPGGTGWRRAPWRVSRPTSRPSSPTTGARRCRSSPSRSKAVSGSMPSGIVATSRVITCPTWGEPVDALEVGPGDDADRAAVVDDDDRAVGPLVQQPKGVGDRRGGREGDRRVVDEVAGLDEVDDLGDDVDRDVLRDDGEATATGHRLGHPAAAHRGHVGHDDRDRRPGAVAGGQVDVHPAADGAAARHHEDVVGTGRRSAVAR